MGDSQLQSEVQTSFLLPATTAGVTPASAYAWIDQNSGCGGAATAGDLDNDGVTDLDITGRNCLAIIGNGGAARNAVGSAGAGTGILNGDTGAADGAYLSETAAVAETASAKTATAAT